MDQVHLEALLERWQEAFERGEDLGAAELCPNNPTLATELARQIAALRQVHNLIRRVADPQLKTPLPSFPLSAPQRRSGHPLVHAHAGETPGVDPPLPDPHLTESMPAARPARGKAQPSFPEVPGHTVLGTLGEGGMGIVYLARDNRLGRLVAIKMILDTRRVRRETLLRFRLEAQALARLQHPAIVQIFDIGEIPAPAGSTSTAARPYFTMEYCPGGSLASWLGGKPQPGREAATVVSHLARAVQAAHAHGIIHRDLKPGNVLLKGGPPGAGAVSTRQEVSPAPPTRIEGSSAAQTRPSKRTPEASVKPGIAETLKISDFGLARSLDQDAGPTQDGDILGTPSYMAPEQAEGKSEVGPAADVYALGAILYECLTGRPPFLSPHPNLTLKLVLESEPVAPSNLLPGCPRDLETIALHCLRKNAAQRYGHAAELADDLDRYLRGEPIHIRPISAGERLWRWARRYPSQAVALVSSAAMLGAFVIALLLSLSNARQETLLKQREVDELQRKEKVHLDVLQYVNQAEQVAAGAAPDDLTAWSSVRHHASTALDLLMREQGMTEEPRLAATRLLHQATHRAQVVNRLARLRRHHADAVFFATLTANLDLPDGLRRARQATADGLALYGVRSTRGHLKAEHATRPETRQIASLCYELLLIEADLLARRLPGQTEVAWHAQLRDALALLDRADTLHPALHTHTSQVRRAEYFDVLGEEASAAAARQRATKIPRTMAIDYFLLGVEHYANDAIDPAVEALSRTLAQQPEHFGAQYLLAVCQLQKGQSDAARAGFNRLLRKRPDFPWARLLRSVAELDRDQTAAGADLDAVLKSSPDRLARYVALVNRGILAIRRKAWAEAVADFESAIAANATALPAYINLALTHRERVRMQSWQPVLLELAPLGGFAHLAVETHRRAAYRDAVAALDRAVAVAPLESRLLHERGRIYLALEDHLRARADLEKAIALALPFAAAGRLGKQRGPGSTLPEDLLELGRLLHHGGDHARAVEVYREALHLRPGLNVAHRLLVEPLMALRRFKDAERALDRYLQGLRRQGAPPGREAQFDRELSIAYQARGVLLAASGKYRPAYDAYCCGLALDHDPDLLVLRGWLALRLQSSRQAEEDFAEASRLRPGHGESFIGLADALIKQGRASDARLAIEKARALPLATPRLLFSTARVHAQLAAHARAMPAERRQAKRDLRTAALFLERALEKLPPAERPSFWKEFIEADTTLAVVRLRQEFARYHAEKR